MCVSILFFASQIEAPLWELLLLYFRYDGNNQEKEVYNSYSMYQKQVCWSVCVCAAGDSFDEDADDGSNAI